MWLLRGRWAIREMWTKERMVVVNELLKNLHGLSNRGFRRVQVGDECTTPPIQSLAEQFDSSSFTAAITTSRNPILPAPFLACILPIYPVVLFEHRQDHPYTTLILKPDVSHGSTPALLQCHVSIPQEASAPAS